MQDESTIQDGTFGDLSWGVAQKSDTDQARQETD
jgi:hypothetical protein